MTSFTTKRGRMRGRVRFGYLSSLKQIQSLLGHPAGRRIFAMDSPVLRSFGPKRHKSGSMGECHRIYPESFAADKLKAH